MTQEFDSQNYSNTVAMSFKDLKDPRRTNKGNLCYPLVEIVFLVISAVISGSNDWTAIEVFGKSQLDWLRKFFPYENGVPSHDTLGTVFAAIDNQSFNDCFVNWINLAVSLSNDEIIAIDGKRLRGSYDTFSSKAAIHMVSAFAADNGVCIGQVTTDKKSNEITAIPKLLKLLDIKGCIITIDAMGCQKEIAKDIRKKGADYVLAVKGNQKELSQQVQKMFSIEDGTSEQNTDCGHGRVEIRKCTVIDNLTFLDCKKEWKDLNCVIKIEAERFDKLSKKQSNETRFYISSLRNSPERFNQIIRKHWAIENNLHWVLDVNFGEDKSRKRKDNSAINFNMITKIAMAMIKNDKDKKTSMIKKRYKAALDQKYREIILKV